MQVELTTLKKLGQVIHNSFRLYRRTHLAHWNVRGPQFPQLHLMFEEQYREIWEALDSLAERLRALGVDVEPRWLTAEDGQVEQEAAAIVQGLAADHRAISRDFVELERAADEAGDTGTADLAVERQRAHDQHAWMLDATAEGL